MAVRAYAVAAALVGSAALHCTSGSPPFRVTAPLGLDEFFPVPEENQLTPAKVELGRRLFFDPLLSADRRVACASCHRPEHVFADNAPRAVGVYGRVGKRNAPSLLNVAYGRVFFWDGRVDSLEQQVLRPIQDSLEMDLALDQLVARLHSDSNYRAAFRRVFGRDVTEGHAARALASYLRTLRSGDAPIDRFRAGDTTALSPDAQLGLRLFVGRANCAACHSGPIFSDEDFHNTGVSWGSGDLGRFAVSGDETDRGAFNTPSLRNVACTAPYMHDGSMRTLDEVIDFYDRGAGVGGQAGVPPNRYLDPELRPLRLASREKAALHAFLKSLGSC